MILYVTVQGQDCWLLASRPASSVKVSFSRLCDIHEGVTDIEERSSLSDTLRWELEYQARYYAGVSAVSYQTAVRHPVALPVLCPFWCGAVRWGSELRFTAPLRITWEEDWSTWEIHSGSTPVEMVPSAKAWTAPLLWGAFSKTPEDAVTTTEDFSALMSFTEDGPVDYAIEPTVSPHYGPEIHGDERVLWDFDWEDWDSIRTTTEFSEFRTRLGFGRAEVVNRFDQTPRRVVKGTAAGRDPDTFARLVATFHSCAGSYYPLWFPHPSSPTRVIEAPSAASETLRVKDASKLGGHPYLALCGFSGAVVCRTIEDATGDVLTLDAPPPDMDMQGVSLRELLLGRFADSRVTCTWSSDIKWTAAANLCELPAEYGTEGEVYGTSYGAIADPFGLIKIVDPAGGAWHWTDNESAVTVGGIVYLPINYDWDEISRGINLDDGETKVRVESFVGNPFLRLLQGVTGRSLAVTFLEWSGVGAPRWLWEGTATTSEQTGLILESSIKGLGTAFDLKVPRRLDGPGCPWVCYSAACGVELASKAVAGTVQGLLDGKLRVQVAVTCTDHQFANGFVIRSAPGAGAASYNILDSTFVLGNEVHLVLEGEWGPALVVGEGVTLHPVCANTWETCIAPVVADYYGGAPRKPAANPAFVPVKQASAGGAKK